MQTNVDSDAQFVWIKTTSSYHENGHVVRAGRQAALVEPLAAPHTVDHGPVPHTRPAAVAVHILQTWNKMNVYRGNLNKNSSQVWKAILSNQLNSVTGYSKRIIFKMYVLKINNSKKLNLTNFQLILTLMSKNFLVPGDASGNLPACIDKLDWIKIGLLSIPNYMRAMRFYSALPNIPVLN